jgi:hypothetical protein
MPQATEKARNGRDQWPAAHGIATTHDDDRESIASRCSGPASIWSPARHPATDRSYQHSGVAGHRGWIACPALNHRATSNRGIEPPLEAQRHNDSGGWTPDQVLRAHVAGLGPDEPTTFGLLGTHLHLHQGHGGDGADCITPRPSFMPQATEKARNGSDQRLAPQGKPLRWILSRVRCIGWFAALPSWI